MKKLIALILASVLLLGIVQSALAEAFINPTILAWGNAFDYTAEVLAKGDATSDAADVPIAGSRLIYDENSFTYGYSGVGVVHGGRESPNGTVSYGIGTGLSGYENYWYVSLTYAANASNTTLNVTGFAFMLACIEVGLPIDLQADDAFDFIGYLLDVLFNQENIAIQMGDLVLIHKLLPGNRHLLAVDSLAYYDEFYYNDTENYIVLE